MASIGERIKARRTELGLSQKSLAQRVGVSQAALSELESGATASTRHGARIAAVLGVNALWLMEGRGARIPDGTAPVIQHQIPPKVLKLAEALTLVPDEKLKAVSVLLGIKL